MATAQALGNDIPHEYEQPHHYITDVEERKMLFSKIRQLLSQTIGVNSTVLALFMVIPLSEMRPLVERLAEYDPSSEAVLGRFILSSTYKSLISDLQFASHSIAIFLAKQTAIIASKIPSATTTPESATKKRKREANTAQPETPSPLQKQVLTSSAESQPAIEPGETARQKSSPTSQILPGKTGSVPGSPASRSRDAVNRAYRTRRPIRTLDPCTIKVQLHWLRRSTTKPTAVSYDTSNDISSLCGGETDYQSWGRAPVAYRFYGIPLRTGQIFTIRANDPEDLP
ncbi:hypothetical protein SEPCBS119000_005732 [Sporothrix epigloea]|uniref:Uncharacterized protein n=1 Tax=Sporothrix epigloea TaxID=1892477 RepID=A0ABP0E1F6_9PEZI